MLRTRVSLYSLACLLAATAVQAVTYIVPSDRDLIRRSDAILVATAVESHAELTDRGSIATVATLRVEEMIKGSLSGDVRVIEPGGTLSDRSLFIAGSPRFDDGKRYLLFLRHMSDGSWTTYGLQIGQFQFTNDLQGRELVARVGGEYLFGLNETDGSYYTDHLRDFGAFRDYIRAVDRAASAPLSANYVVDASTALRMTFPEFRPMSYGLKPAPFFSRTDYLMTGNPRWQSGPNVTFGHCCPGNYGPMPGGVDGLAGAQTAVTAWNGLGSIGYSWGTETPGKTGGLFHGGNNGSSTILFNDPNGELACCPGAVAIGGTWSIGTYSLGGVTYGDTAEGDVVINKNASLPGFLTQSLFVALVTHEVGHTLGFRHADGTADSNSPPPACAAPLPCAAQGAAVMAHIIPSTGPFSPQQWDRDAANTVYGAGAVCNAATSVSVSATATSITAGQSTQLTANVTGGSSPFNYQWYQGAAGNTSTPVGNGQSINVSPSSNTSYWVRVTPTCGGTATDSTAIAITVTCQNPAIIAQPQSTSVLSGSSTTLSVSATGSNPTYQWFQGTPPSGTPLGGQTGSSLFTGNLSTTTSFYVVVSGCGQSVTSNAATVTVAPCTQAAITTQPQNTSIVAGQSATLTVAATGTNLQYQWYTGASGNTNVPVNGAVTPVLTVSPTVTTSYWVRVVSACGSQTPANSNTATVTIGPACNTTLTGITVTPNNPLPAQSFTLTANASTTSGSLSYQWYRGGQGDTSNPIGNAQTITVTQTAASQAYWVLVVSTCGGVQPAAQTTVTLNTGSCGTNPNQMCISSARYRVTLTATDPRTGKTGNGVANYQSDVFGYFTLPDFSNPGDPQVFVKVLGPVAPPIGQNAPWVFFAGLTDLRYTLTVLDTATGQTFNTYNVNPPAQDPRGLNAQQTIGDFEVNGVNAHSGDKNAQCAPVQITTTQTAATPGNCPSNASTLCLLNRFTVSMRAKVNNASGATDSGVTIPANGQFGFFTTPNIAGPTDVQGFIKMLDATTLNLGYWVFLGGLTDFELTYTVTDTTTGKRKVYLKPAGSTCGWSDVPNAF